MQVIVSQLLIHYERRGNGKLVLLLHGWGDSAKGLQQLQQQLAADYDVLAIDLPGFGDSQPPKTVWDLDNYANFIRLMLAKLDITQLYAVIGHSNGGALAIRAIAHNELHPQKLVLIAAAGIRNSQNGRRLLLKIIAKVGKVATLWLPAGYRRRLRQRLYGVAGSDMLVVEQLQETFKKTVRQDVQADATKLKTPTLLIYASADQAVPLQDGERYNKLIEGSKLLILDGGHFVHHDQPGAVEQAIKEFLQ